MSRFDPPAAGWQPVALRNGVEMTRDIHEHIAGLIQAALAEAGYPVGRRWNDRRHRADMVGPVAPDSVLARARALAFDRAGFAFDWVDPDEYRKVSA